jgi:hypothetical protein
MATKYLLIAAMIFSLTACSSANGGSKRITLIFPENFVGDVYVVAGGSNDINAQDEIKIPPSGIVYLANFSEIEQLPRKAFTAKTQAGKLIRSSLEADSIGPRLLWPVGRQGGELLYFVVGSLDDKIKLSTEKERRWPEIIGRLKKR